MNEGNSDQIAQIKNHCWCVSPQFLANEVYGNPCEKHCFPSVMCVGRSLAWLSSGGCITLISRLAQPWAMLGTGPQSTRLLLLELFFEVAIHQVNPICWFHRYNELKLSSDVWETHQNVRLSDLIQQRISRFWQHRQPIFPPRRIPPLLTESSDFHRLNLVRMNLSTRSRF